MITIDVKPTITYVEAPVHRITPHVWPEQFRRDWTAWRTGRLTLNPPPKES